MNHRLPWTFNRLYKLNTSSKRSYQNDASYNVIIAAKYKQSGVFKWPNGACYNGEFLENKRHGKGRQKWPDGSSYVGEFLHDVREGFGRHSWFNGEVFYRNYSDYA